MANNDRGGAPSDLRLPGRAPPPKGRAGLLVAGLVLAAVMGVGLGLAARPELIGSGKAAAPMQAATQAPDERMQVQVNPQAAPEKPTTPSADDGRLEVLPDDMVRAAPQPPQPPLAPQAPIPQTPPVPPEAPLAPQTPRPRTQAQASFDCAQARPGAEEMVCGDPRLAAADRRLAMAYRRALEAGVPDRVLRHQQGRWYEAREAAAQDAPQAVAQVYEARIAELQDQTAEARGLDR
jgi:uncharacterized protein YecT (DUF1311 family)